MRNIEKTQPKLWTTALLTVVIAFVIIIGYGITLIYLSWPIENYTIANAGVFGDSFGVITSLFSALAFAGVLFTIAIQREELNLQKKEAAESKDELIKQRFENSFFQMLNMYNQILSEITFIDTRAQGHVAPKGRYALKKMKEEVISAFKARQVKNGSGIEQINKGFEQFYETKGIQLSHYFRFLNGIFDLIYQSKIDEKKFYVNLIKSQLSDQELFLMYYYALSDYSGDFKKYLSEFKLMENMRPTDLDLEEHSSLISDVGFKFNNT